MLGGEARRMKRLFRAHVEVHVVEDDLDGRLILLVAASYRCRHYGMVAMEKQRGAQCDSRPLVGLSGTETTRVRPRETQPHPSRAVRGSGAV
jgi:hypothetical protein